MFFSPTAVLRGSHGLNSIEACWFQFGCRLEKGFREGSASQKCKKPQENKAKLLFFTIFHIKRNGFFTVLRFLHFRTRILSKSATFLLILMKNVMVFLTFLRFLHFRTRILSKSATF